MSVQRTILVALCAVAAAGGAAYYFSRDEAVQESTPPPARLFDASEKAPIPSEPAKTVTVLKAVTIPAAYHGTWASTIAQCTDQDGVERVSITADTIQYYEGEGRPKRITKGTTPRSHQFIMAFRGEGQTWETDESWVLNGAGDTLIIDTDDESSGEQSLPLTWLRCDGKPVS